MPLLVDRLVPAADGTTKSLVLDVLTYCASVHGQRIKYYVTHNGVLQRLESLYSDPSKCIRLSMIRFFRTFVSSNDEALNRYVTKHDLFSPIFRLTQGNHRDNMLSSAVLDLLNSSVTLNMRVIVPYLMEKYRGQIAEGPRAAHPVMRRIREKFDTILQERQQQMKKPATELPHG